MEDSALRLWIRAKLDGGSLPNAGLLKLWGGEGTGRPCEACEEIIPNVALEIEGLSADGGTLRFHVKCFHLWDAERREEGHQPSGPA